MSKCKSRSFLGQDFRIRLQAVACGIRKSRVGVRWRFGNRHLEMKATTVERSKMKIARFEAGGKRMCGLIEGENVKAIKGLPWESLETTGEDYPLSAVKLLSPV